MENVEIKMPGQVIERGKSLGVTIPAEIVKALKLTAGQTIDWRVGEFNDVLGVLIVPVRDCGT